MRAKEHDPQHPDLQAGGHEDAQDLAVGGVDAPGRHIARALSHRAGDVGGQHGDVESRRGDVLLDDAVGCDNCDGNSGE